jgi:hypothetical protein
MKKELTREIKNMCAKIAQQTDENDHTGAKITIAEFVGLRDYQKIFECIKTIHDIEGSMPDELIQYRYRKGHEMMTRIKTYFSTEIYNLINQAQ